MEDETKVCQTPHRVLTSTKLFTLTEGAVNQQLDFYINVSLLPHSLLLFKTHVVVQQP